MKCFRNTMFPIKTIFTRPDLKFLGDWFLIYIRVDVVPSGRLQFPISQFRSSEVILHTVKKM